MLQYILHERRIWRHFGGKPSHELTDAATKRIPETESPANTPPFRTPWKSRFNPNGNRSRWSYWSRTRLRHRCERRCQKFELQDRRYSIAGVIREVNAHAAIIDGEKKVDHDLEGCDLIRRNWKQVIPELECIGEKLRVQIRDTPETFPARLKAENNFLLTELKKGEGVFMIPQL